MKLHKHFLPEDLGQASREFWCIKDLLQKITFLIEEGEIEKAKRLSIDLTRSLHELSRLSAKKYEQDQMNQIVEMMGSAGINVQVIRKLHHE